MLKGLEGCEGHGIMLWIRRGGSKGCEKIDGMNAWFAPFFRPWRGVVMREMLLSELRTHV